MPTTGHCALALLGILFSLVCVTAAVADAAKIPEAIALPTLEAVLAQDFEVSVMTTSHGVFNGTLRVKGSINFPDRLHGELVPRGSPLLQEGQTALPCFSRERDFTDDKFAPALTPTVGDSSGDKNKQKAIKAREAALAALGVERPTLLAFDIKLHHSNSPRGGITVYALPAETEAMVEARETLQDGAASPTASASFFFRPERESVTGSVLNELPFLARMTSSVLTFGDGKDDDRRDSESAASGLEGHFTLRLFSEHEFSIELQIPLAAGNGKTEKVWVHGYTQPNPNVFARGENKRPWWHFIALIAIGSLTSVVQVLTGVTDGKKKAAERRALEDATAEQKKLKQPSKGKKDN